MVEIFEKFSALNRSLLDETFEHLWESKKMNALCSFLIVFLDELTREKNEFRDKINKLEDNVANGKNKLS